MEKCNICLTKIKKRNKNKHEQPKKHKIFSNLILNKYNVRNPEIDKFKDINQSYYDEYKKKFDNFTACVKWMNNGLVVKKISAPSTTTLQKAWLFKPSVIELPIVVRVSPLDFLYTFDRNCINDEVDEIAITFLSDLKDITFSHYMAEPKSTLCRKLVRNSIEEDFGNFDYNWLQ